MLVPPDPKPLAPSDEFEPYASPAEAGAPTVGGFWRWAFSDLRQNAVRGVLAEYLVGKALGLDLSPASRALWDDADLVLPDGALVEVKASAYLQAWPQRRLSRIHFSGLRGQAWDEQAMRRSGPAVCRADVYVFCVQTARSHAEFDPLDLSQWAFYVVPRGDIEARGTDSISLGAVESLAERVGYSGLHSAVVSALAR